MKNKLIIAGGTGAVGEALVDYFRDRFESIVILTRAERPESGNVRFAVWDARNRGAWTAELEGADVLVNLTGKSVNSRNTAANQQEILRSRVDATRVLGQAVEACAVPPKLWINASAAAIYGDTGDRVVDEDSPWAGDATAEISKQWEAAFLESACPQTRKVILRIGLVLQKDKGVVEVLSKLARFGLAGTVGSGRQYVSWIHEADFVRLVEWVVDHNEISGPINAVSPDPVTNAAFMRGFREGLGVKIGLPAPAWATRMGAYLMGTNAELVLTGRRVHSKMLAGRFSFLFPKYKSAIGSLLK
jgi:uncharacterized protein (TIGR01777 family)